jgi:hypothetical protein
METYLDKLTVVLILHFMLFFSAEDEKNKLSIPLFALSMCSTSHHQP